MNGFQKFLFSLLLSIAISGSATGQSRITTLTLLNEMTDMERLSNLPATPYKSVQFSSYDRRSIAPYQEHWYGNADGFGNAPAAGFEEVLREPDDNGIGEYLIADIKQPGTIVRLWSAGIKGTLRLFLDNAATPVFEGPAEDLFWNTARALTGIESLDEAFRQFDASYFPIPFADRCRIEYTGNLSELHFYHIGFRLYEPGIHVTTFNRSEITQNLTNVNAVIDRLKNPGAFVNPGSSFDVSISDIVGKGAIMDLWNYQGSRAINYFSVKAEGGDPDQLLRKLVMNIYFDNSPTPQVHAPLGDFFNTTPGINTYESATFSVHPDGWMECRFVMPFKTNVRIEIENRLDDDARIKANINMKDYQWSDASSMHFRARWKISHGLTASDTRITDIPYLMAFGSGRIVGAATHVYNPSNVPTSWGNWWGEGDEKIFIDDDDFPSFFGTGSEDYYNYSWSSSRIFSYPYCGQPRNDGPGNRGYVTNFRWHISDDIPFYDKIAFYMELLHHGVVPGFIYARTIYYYALPSAIDDFQVISSDDTRDITYSVWNPEALKGSAGYTFIGADKLVAPSPGSVIEPGNLWSEGKILMWKPEEQGNRLSLNISLDEAKENTRLGLTLAKMPDGGIVSVSVNGNPVKWAGGALIDLHCETQVILENYFSESLNLKKGNNTLVFEYEGTVPGKKIGIDYIWIRK